ncbi:MAG: rod shape-determining protein MreD, partial [Chroococcidiopsidaceae cyanobacterium CP_BM_RX_35]|nr:rod shape-determining protein MreD [Chroococcidiopsidaceae cyanobacterium CP_BM_RX_35]
MTVSEWHPLIRQVINWTVTIGSALLCLLLLPMRLPGMELLGITPNWSLIWVVTWSIKRTAIQGASAGLVLGLLQDGMTSPDPTHTLSLSLVGVLTARLQKPRYIKEDFISIALIVFCMAVLAETLTALQFSFISHSFDVDSCAADVPCSTNAIPNLAEIWTYYQRIALASAILSSLWAPVVYYPLNRWWEWFNMLKPSKVLR